MLHAADISKSHGSNLLFKNVQLDLAKGDRLALRGPSGSGKTTLIHILSGLDPDFSGTVTRGSEKTSVVFQEGALFPYKSVKENIEYPLSGKSGNASLYQSWLEVCDLQKIEASYPYQLSQGMKQKVAIIRGFITRPDLIFMDEPFNGVDGESTQKIMTHILQHHHTATMVIASHSDNDESFCNRTFTL